MNGASAGGDLSIDGHGLDDTQIRSILERRVRIATERTVAREAGTAVIVCSIGGERFAVPLAAIAEVLPATSPVPVPNAPDSLVGLIVRRGLVYNLIDPSSALGVARRTSVHVLLLRGPVPRIALRVDEATEVSEVSEVAGAPCDGGGLTETRFFADGARVELIAVRQLIARLGHTGRIGPT